MKMIMSWCPRQIPPSPCDPCAPKAGAPNWKSIGYDGTVDIRFYYQIHQPKYSYVGPQTLCGGHTITFGPHSLPDPGYWFQPPYVPQGSTDIYVFFTATSVLIGTGAPTVLPN